MCVTDGELQNRTVLAYPRCITDTAHSRAGCVHIAGRSPQLANLQACAKNVGRYLAVPPAPSHRFHFLLEWAFHLHAQLQVTSSPQNLLILPPPPQRKTTQLDPHEARIYKALLTKAGGSLHQLTANRSVCLPGGLTLGLAPHVSLIASTCTHRGGHPELGSMTGRVSGTKAIREVERVVDRAAIGTSSGDDWHVSLEHAQRLTNCSLTASSLAHFRTFVRNVLGIQPKLWRSSPRALRIFITQREAMSGRQIVQLPAFLAELRASVGSRLGATPFFEVADWTRNSTERYTHTTQAFRDVIGTRHQHSRPPRFHAVHAHTCKRHILHSSPASM